MNKLFLLIYFTYLLTINVFSQKIDSIKYSNGYLYFHEYGKGKPVIMLSGGPGFSCEKEQEIAEKLSNKYRLIVLEQRGTGKSIPKMLDSTTINLKAYHSDLNKLLHHLKLKDAIFYGHSWGGLLAMSFASAYPQKVKALVLVGTSSFKPNNDFWQTLQLNRYARYGQLEWQQLDSMHIKEKQGIMTFMDSLDHRKLINHTNIFDIQSVDNLSFRLSASTMNYKTMELMLVDLKKIKLDLTPQIRLYKKPIYAICGKQDPLSFVTYELKILKPETQITWIQACGHYPSYEQEIVFYKSLTTILDKIK